MLDTNICIYYLKGEFDLKSKFEEVGYDNLGISEITIAELKYGAYNSKRIEENLYVVNKLAQKINLFPVLPTLDIYAKEKTKLKKEGRLIDDFDLLIGCTAVFNELIIITRNVKHFDRIRGLEIENWVK